jgi:hypothetical protein
MTAMAVMASMRFFVTYTELKLCYRFMVIKRGKLFFSKKVYHKKTFPINKSKNMFSSKYAPLGILGC